MDPVGDVSISVTGGAAAGVAGGAVVGAGAWLLGAFPASATVTRLEPVSLGVVSFTFGPMMGLLEKLEKKPGTLVGFAYLRGNLLKKLAEKAI